MSVKTSMPILGVPFYERNNVNRWFYTVVFLGNYLFEDYAEGKGSHTGVDIDASKYLNGKTPVLAVLDGVVVKVRKNKGGFGYHVVVKSENVPDPDNFEQKTTLFSCFAHLSEIAVAEGQNVVHGDKIGVTGSTGNSTGSHLHFQIDRESAPFHPFWPFDAVGMKKMGFRKMWDAVNAGLGFDDAKRFCVNPMIYVQRFLDKIEVFPDVSASHKNYEAIYWLFEKKIVSGYENGFFLPEKSLSRAEFLKIVVSAFFPDFEVAGSGGEEWFLPYFDFAVKNGWVEGDLRAGAEISRAEGLKIVAKIGNVVLPDFDGDFTDVRAEMWFAKYAAWAKRENLLDFGEFFEGGRPLSRGEVCGVIFALSNE